MVADTIRRAATLRGERARGRWPVRGPIDYVGWGMCRSGHRTNNPAWVRLHRRPAVARAGDRSAGRFDPPEAVRSFVVRDPGQGARRARTRPRPAFARVARTIRRDPSISRARIVAARPPRASGRTTTIPVPPDPLPFAEHGRPGGGSTLLWPGGPLPSPGQGGRGLETLPVTGSGVAVGRAVGRGVGFAVGRGVGCAVGWGVGW